jgi:HK97 family phage major capsid protein
MDREQRRARVEELERWVAEQHAEFAEEGFPDEVRATWDANNQELDSHRAILRELEARDARVRALAANGGTPPEPGGGGDLPPTTRGGGSPGPVMISRMSESQVYDLDSIRANPFQPEQTQEELRSRAMRAVELAHFPERVERSAAQAHVERLLSRGDEDLESSLIARRILTTGAPAYRRAFVKTLKAQMNRTFPSLSSEEQRAMERVEQMRAMTVGTGSAGGFAVPYTLDPTVIPTSSLSVNPYRAICRVEQITVLQWLGVTSAGVTSSYGTEAAAASDNSPTLAQPSMNMVRAFCFVPVSIELTQDWGALQSELANLIQDSKDDLEASKFATGSGTNEPTGMITGATTTVTGTGGAATFVVGDLYAVEQALGPRFRPRAQWVGNRFTYNKARQFDTAGGANLVMYLPAGLANDVPRGGNMGQTVLGYPANEASGMASVLTTGSKILVLGDPRYYIIVDRIGMDIEVIPHLFGAAQGNLPTGQRGFYAFWRNNARVLDPNAFRVLVTA